MSEQPKAEHWKVFDREYPNDFVTYFCDEETANTLADLETRADQEWGCRIYVAKRLN